MPVEIRELYIKAVIDTGKAASPASVPGEAQPDTATAGKSPEQDDLIAICVEKVMEILKDKQER